METNNSNQTETNEKHIAGTVGGANNASTTDGEQIGENTSDENASGIRPDEKTKKDDTPSGAKVTDKEKGDDLGALSDTGMDGSRGNFGSVPMGSGDLGGGGTDR